MHSTDVYRSEAVEESCEMLPLSPEYPAGLAGRCWWFQQFLAIDGAGAAGRRDEIPSKGAFTPVH